MIETILEGRSLITFQDAASLSIATRDPRFESLIASTSCLVTIVRTNYDTEITTLFGLMRKIQVTAKFLFIETPVLNYNLLQNKTINYKVFINHGWNGKSQMYLLSMNDAFDTVCKMNDLPIGHQYVVTSLCPTVGKAHAEIYNGLCPLRLENPQGKVLKVSFIGTSPYIIHEPLGGSEVNLMRIFAKKFKFTPKFVPERSFDPIQSNGTIYGMFHTVRYIMKFVRNF